MSLGHHLRKKKKQKTLEDARSKGIVSETPNYALLEDDSLKTTEELQLENLLFGKQTRPSASDTANEPGHSELKNVLDSELFYVDNAQSQQRDKDDASRSPTSDQPTSFLYEPHSEENDDAHSEVLPHTARGKSGAAWRDPSDASLSISLVATKQLRKMRDNVREDNVAGNEYEARLRRQFQNIHPTPNWAVEARRKLHGNSVKRRRESQSSVSSSEEHAVSPDITEFIDPQDSRRSAVHPPLPSGALSVERLRDANQTSRSQGAIVSLGFHPDPKVPVLYTASSNRRLHLFNIDGSTNPHLQTLHIPSLPFSKVSFHPHGTSILLTGQRPFYYTYDLQSGKTIRTLPSSQGMTGVDNHAIGSRSFSPSGSLLAIAGKRGYLQILDSSASGGEQIVATLKGNSPIRDLWWHPSEKEIWTLGQDSEVYIWDVGSRRCVSKWTDEGGYGSKLLAGDHSRRYLATGADSGFVNIYSLETLSHFRGSKPQPLKSIGNLTTPISSLVFNSDSQLLAVASDAAKDQMRLIHLPSLTAFANWPTSSSPLGIVRDVAFSPTSKYMCLGNSQGVALLYSLRHYSHS